MAYDEGVAQRVREHLQSRSDITERKMFGGLAFMAHGHMFIGILGDRLMVRVGPDDYAKALSQAHVQEMDFTGRPMRGYVYVEPDGFESDAQLESWVNQGYALVGALPPKLSK
jgi:TfoX/Sxy family transcriptional regulator of competence genes